MGSKIPNIQQTSFTDGSLAGAQQEIGDAYDALAASGLAVDAAERIRSEWEPCWTKRNFGLGPDHTQEVRILRICLANVSLALSTCLKAGSDGSHE